MYQRSGLFGKVIGFNVFSVVGTSEQVYCLQQLVAQKLLQAHYIYIILNLYRELKFFFHLALFFAMGGLFSTELEQTDGRFDIISELFGKHFIQFLLNYV